jgi:hypothetical protein
MRLNEYLFSGTDPCITPGGFGGRAFYTWVGTRLIVALLLSGCLTQRLSAETVFAGRDCWGPPGLFSFRTFDGTNTQIHLAKYNNGTIKSVFSKSFGYSTMNPICVSNGVIVTTVEGTVAKLDMKGEFLFRTKLKGFQGTWLKSGRIGNNSIFVTSAMYGKSSFNFYIYLVDVSGMGPVIKGKFEILQPIAVIPTFDEVIVVGTKETTRLKMPKGL